MSRFLINSAVFGMIFAALADLTLAGNLGALGLVGAAVAGVTLETLKGFLPGNNT